MGEKPKVEQSDGDAPDPVDEFKPRRILPDMKDPEFVERYRKQCQKLAASFDQQEFEWWERLQSDEGWV